MDAEDKELQSDVAVVLESSDFEASTVDKISNVDTTPSSEKAWTSVIRILADVESTMAAGAAGLLAIVVVSVFGRIGCLVVGVLGGLLLHASIDKRKDYSAWREPFNKHSADTILDNSRQDDLPADIIPPKTNLAIRYFWDLLIRDYVDWWFSPLSTDTDFPSACRRSLEYMTSSFALHVQSKVPAEMVMLAIMSASSTLIVFFRELRSALLETESPTSVAEYIRNNPDSALAQMVDEKFQQEKLRHLSSRLLARFAKKTDLACEAGGLFAREMMAMQVLNLTASSCSTASYINWYIVETFKEVQEEGGLLANDSRAKEAEEAMARAVAEAAEMTRLLESEKGGVQELPIAHEEIATPTLEIEDSAPRTTFASILQHPGILPPPPDRIDAVEAELQNTPSEDTLEYTADAVDSPSRLSTSSLQHDDPPQDTLQGANISLMDLSTDAGTDKPVRQKSSLSYMITIEPVGGRVPGWVSIKLFTDFESLHDVLRRLAYVGGIPFPTDLPEWKGKMHQPISDELEKYLKTALCKKQLADSEAMKRFFGKEITEQSLAKKKTWPPLKVGGVKEAMLSSAEGSQKLFAAAWATTGIKKKRSSQQIGKEKSRGDLTLKEIPKEEVTPDEDTAYHSPLFRESATFSGSGSLNNLGDTLQRNSTSSSLNGYSFIGDDTSKSGSTTSLNTPDNLQEIPVDVEPDTPRLPQPDPPETQPEMPIVEPPTQPPPLPERPKPTPFKYTAPELSANDAQQILDIGFSILSEFYALSPRTWMIRKSLLNLLKSLLLSNGRTYIETIRTMIQEDLIKKCLTSDEWLASQVKAVTESMWPPAPWPSMDDEAYKQQARELFLNKLLPETMRGLMGGAATTQALEVVFEALQDQNVAKGILVALMCDVLRALQV